ncbi:MAG: hypothetical protein K1X95_10555 [Acidimicrobiia bacterium]|nr:hypothetical protein [Acidimicrobiia bacterium]
MYLSPEARLAIVAARQHRTFTLAQALEAGFTRDRVRRLLAIGAWLELRPRVYRLAGAGMVSSDELLMAHVLHTGGHAAGFSSAHLHRIVERAPAEPEVIIGRNAWSDRHTGLVSVTDRLDPVDLTLVDGIPALTPVRTLLHIGGRVHPEVLGVLCDRAVTSKLVDPVRLELRARELRAPRRNGCARVLAVFADRHPDLAEARNEWEARLLHLSRRFGLPDPVPNFALRIGGRRRFLDLAWVDQLVVVEFDGYAWHSDRRTFDDDRVRQNELVAAGWQPFRLTSTALRNGELAAFEPIARVVRHRTSAPHPQTRAG